MQQRSAHPRCRLQVFTVSRTSFRCCFRPDSSGALQFELVVEYGNIGLMLTKSGVELGKNVCVVTKCMSIPLSKYESG